MGFTGFTADTFEQLIRALALKIIGPGVTIFGNGPDGGREASFRGKIPYPYPPCTMWEGYGVLQAKFKERVESTERDQVWARKQLNAEIAMWRSSTRRNPKPDYFIFCTNVELTSASGGGRSILEGVLEKAMPILGLKGYAIWDGNQINTFVDGYADIRTRFTCFYTSGDLLAEFSKVIKEVQNPDSVLGAFLAKEILADEDARLSQAGDRSEDRIRLASVFSDLPTSTEENKMEWGPDGDYEQSGSLNELMRAASHKLDPLALYEQSESSNTSRAIGRYLFLGGPGSGKSTLGQFIAQIHRAALLLRRPEYRIEQKVRVVINEIVNRCAIEGISMPPTPRFPFRIELNTFAKALASKETSGVRTMSAFLRKVLSRDITISHNDLMSWLKAYPWLLILDGLDEVPTSSNREEVVNEIQSFLNEARDCEADLMIIASSRPDGYAGEFHGDNIAQRFLTPLSKKKALECAELYVKAKFASKGDQRGEGAMSILRSAADNPLVARLMRSPLQVTFMVTVVSASGRPSESRWQLFSDYYRTIYERELHKAVPPFDIALRERRQDIDSLHYQIGFMLQCRGESSGGTQAEIVMSEFDELVTNCLQENGLDELELKRQKDLLIGAAKQRLVFLTSRTLDRLSFDVRSLQEYMAAACLTNADSLDVGRRLEFIAHSAYWRNTFLFAVGRYFVDPQKRQHRDKIRVLCEDLNRSDLVRAGVRLGSRCALDILRSGVVGNVPLVNRSLAASALLLLAEPRADSEQVNYRLASVYDETLRIEYEEVIRSHILKCDLSYNVNSWVLLLMLEERNIRWAKDIISHHWPSEDRTAAYILFCYLDQGDFIAPSTRDSLLADKILGLTSRSSPFAKRSLIDRGFPPSIINGSWFEELSSWWHADRLECELTIDAEPIGIKVLFRGLPGDADQQQLEKILGILAVDKVHNDWHILRALHVFYSNPDVNGLVECLELLAKSFEPKVWKAAANFCPWILSGVLSVCDTSENLLASAARIRAGGMGNANDWRIVQTILLENGCPLTSISQGLPQFSDLWVLGVHKIRRETSYSSDFARVNAAFLEEMGRCPGETVRETLAWLFSWFTRETNTLHEFDPVRLCEIVLSPQVRPKWWSGSFSIDGSHLGSSQMLNFFDKFGRFDGLFFGRKSWTGSVYPAQALATAFEANNTLEGIPRLLSFWLGGGKVFEITALAPWRGLLTSSNIRLKFAGAVIAMANIQLASIAEIRDILVEVFQECHDSDICDLVLTISANYGRRHSEFDQLLLDLAPYIVHSECEMSARQSEVRIALLEGRRSGFDKDKLREFGLPLS